MQIKRDIMWRVAVVYVFMVIIGFLIIGRIVQLQFFQGHMWREKAKANATRNITIEPNRGDICADDGRILASSVPYYTLRVDFKTDGLTEDIFYDGVDSLALCLSDLFKDKTKEEYQEDLVSGYKRGLRYYLLKRRVSYQELKEVKTFPVFRKGMYIGGLIVEQSNRRIKPYDLLAARTIGDLNESGNVVGLEGAYEKELKGVEGIVIKQRMANGAWRPIKNGEQVEPRDGLDVLTTIDVELQDVAQAALYEQLQKHGAQHGSVILMEVKTGNIKAIANLKRTSDNNYRESYNYAVGESTEPGSTFKLASMIVALEDNVVDLDDSIKTGNGVVKFYDSKLKDSKEGGYGTISVKQVFEYSSNVGIAKIIFENYKNRPRDFVDKLYDMGLDKPLGIEIKGEGKPSIHYPGSSTWSGLSLPWMSIGYEVQLTPLQILTLYNAIANNGVMVKPRFVKGLMYHGTLQKSFSPHIINPAICSKETLDKVRLMLEGVVENGTARNLKNSNYKIAGKTGTSQIAKGSSGYGKRGKMSYQASFAGYFPAENPKYSCIVVVNSPSNSVYYGNLVAGPIFKDIADKVYSSNIDFHGPVNRLAAVRKIKDVPYSKNGLRSELEELFSTLNYSVKSGEQTSDWVTTASRDTCVSFTKRRVKRGVVPNVVQMGLKDALFLLENAGLKVRFKGRGSVKWQSVSPGTLIKPGSIIELRMSFTE